MKRNAFLSFALAAILIAGVGTTFGQSRAEGEIFQLVNRERSRVRLGVLAWDDRLGKLARDYSRKMAREGFFDHYDRDGQTVMDRAESARIADWSEIGENLFVCESHTDFTRTAIRGWLQSHTHRTNMLNREWTATGIGIATARDGSIFITQVFTRQ